MFKPRKQIWRDNTEPPKNYIWEKLNESGSYVGTFEFNGERWVKIKDSSSENPGGGSCSCDDKFVYITKEKRIVYANGNDGKQSYIPYDTAPTENSLVMRTGDGRIKSAEAKEEKDVVTLKDICWNE
mgnify:CR=1 FL=1